MKTLKHKGIKTKLFLCFYALVIFSGVLLKPAAASADSLGVLLTASSPPAQSILLLNLPRVYVLPDSPLYKVVDFWRKTQLFLAKTDEQKEKELTGLAEFKLAEAVGLWQRGELDPRLLADTLAQHKFYFEQAQKLAGPADALQRLLTQQQLLQQALTTQDPSLAKLAAQVLGVSAPPSSGSLQLKGLEPH